MPYRPHLLPALVTVVLLTIGGWAGTWAAPGDSRAEPVPFGTEAAAGPWRLTVLEVLTDADATAQVTAASPANEPPRDGFTYVLIRLRAVNGSDRPHPLDANDFALTGSSGLVRRFVGAVPPAPVIDGPVAPGETREGWLVLGAPTDETNLLLLFDSIALPGAWADRLLALQNGATIADSPVAATPDTAGVDPGAPVGLGESFTTADWRIDVLETARGQAVYNLYPASDYRTTALGAAYVDDPTDRDGDGAIGWVAVRVRVTSLRPGPNPAFLPSTAFMQVDAAGNAVPHTILLTPPAPEISGAYYPGATREGWIVLELREVGSPPLIRFLPFRDNPDPRYLSFAA